MKSVSNFSAWFGDIVFGCWVGRWIQIFEAMKKYNLGIEEATRVILVSRAVRREFSRCSTMTPNRAIQQLVSKISFDNILYESSSDDDLASDDDEQHPLAAIREGLRVDPLQEMSTGTSSASVTSNTRSSRSFDAESRKNARKRLSTQHSPRKISKQFLRNSSTGSNASASSSRGSTKGTPTVAGRKRSVDEIGERASEDLVRPPRGRVDSISAEVDAKMASTERSLVDSGGNTTGNTDVIIRAKRALCPSEDVVGTDPAAATSTTGNNAIDMGQR